MRDGRGEKPGGSRVVNELLIRLPPFFFNNFVPQNSNVQRHDDLNTSLWFSLTNSTYMIIINFRFNSSTALHFF